jgi:hypothetical protein
MALTLFRPRMRRMCRAGMVDETKRKHRGARAELIACAWLLSNGYEVFRNISPHGECDIIGKKGVRIELFDVKSREVSSLARLKEEQIAAGVKLLFVSPDGSCRIIETTPARQKQCVECGKDIRSRYPSQRYCGIDCRITFGKRRHRSSDLLAAQASAAVIAQ